MLINSLNSEVPCRKLLKEQKNPLLTDGVGQQDTILTFKNAAYAKTSYFLNKCSFWVQATFQMIVSRHLQQKEFHLSPLHCWCAALGESITFPQYLTCCRTQNYLLTLIKSFQKSPADYFGKKSY